MRVLIVETILATPHTETSVELAALHAMAGDKVDYLPLYRYLGSYPWNSPIGGNPSNSRDVKAWDQFIVKHLEQYCQFINLQYVFDGLPLDIIESLSVQAYSERAAKTIDPAAFYDSKNTEKLKTAERLILQQVSLASRIIFTSVMNTQPELIYAFNGRTPATWPIFCVASSMNKKAKFHERGATFDKYAISDLPFAFAGTWRQMINDFSRHRDRQVARLSAAYFYHRQRKGETLNFSYHVRRTENDAFSYPGLSDIFVVYFCTSDFEINTLPNQDVYFDTLPSQRHCIELLKHCCEELGIQLVIKSHPSGIDDESNYQDLADGIKCLYLSPDCEISGYSVGRRALARFSVGSTIGFELMYQGFSCAVMSKCLLFDHPDSILTLDYKSVVEHIMRPNNPHAGQEIAMMVGDFYLNYGVNYRFFKPSGPFAGDLDLP